MDYLNFKRYEPEQPEFGLDAAYIKDQNGNDWYDLQKSITGKYIVAFDNASRVIHCISEDAGAMFPVLLSITQTDELPEGCSIDGTWVYLNGEIAQLPSS